MTYALVIGGANIDFVGIPDNPLIWHDKNPGTITTSLGGVGRNIAENLARLGVSTKLLSVAGDDAYGAYLIDETTKVGVDMSNVQILQNQRSSVYFSVMDGKDDMAVALSDMAIVDQLTPELLAPYASLIRGAQLVILDTNLLAETLSYLLTHFPTTRFLVDTVSVSKAAKIQSLLPHIDTLKPNRLEAELLAEMPINTVSDAFSAADKLLKKGVKRVFISLGAEGSIYVDKQKQLHAPAQPTKVINATGAGDAMTAGIAYGIIHQLPTETVLRIANATAAFTLTAQSTIHPQLSEKQINQFI